VSTVKKSQATIPAACRRRNARQACYLPAQHGQLLAEHQDLQVLGEAAAGQQDEQLDGAAECQVGELRQHAG
jgi:hypothetical protein